MKVRRWPMTDFRYTIFYVLDREAEAIDVLRIIDSKQVARPQACAAVTLRSWRIPRRACPDQHRQRGQQCPYQHDSLPVS